MFLLFWNNFFLQFLFFHFFATVDFFLLCIIEVFKQGCFLDTSYVFLLNSKNSFLTLLQPRGAWAFFIGNLNTLCEYKIWMNSYSVRWLHWEKKRKKLNTFQKQNPLLDVIRHQEGFVYFFLCKKDFKNPLISKILLF